jgi:hypothetical protein
MKIVRRKVQTVRDSRGLLSIFEKGASLPFALRRCFVISHVPKGATRAEHEASCDQFIVALAGTCRLTLRDHRTETSKQLRRPAEGVLVAKGTWLRLDRFSTGAIVLVCAAEKYRPRRESRQTKAADARASLRRAR